MRGRGQLLVAGCAAPHQSRRLCMSTTGDWRLPTADSLGRRDALEVLPQGALCGRDQIGIKLGASAAP